MTHTKVLAMKFTTAIYLSASTTTTTTRTVCVYMITRVKIEFKIWSKVRVKRNVNTWLSLCVARGLEQISRVLLDDRTRAFCGVLLDVIAFIVSLKRSDSSEHKECLCLVFCLCEFNSGEYGVESMRVLLVYAKYAVKRDAQDLHKLGQRH